MIMRVRLAAGTGLLVALVLGGCVTPASNPVSYAAKVHLTASDASSELRTAQLATQTWLDGRLPGPYLEAVVVDAENALGAVESTFSAVQPPDDPDSARLAERTGELLGHGSDSIQGLRIAIRQSDRPAIAAALDDVKQAADDADALAERTA